MGIANLFQPNQQVASIADISLDKLKELGIHGILLDLDNTLVKWNSQLLSNQVIKWVRMAKKEGFALCIVSNAISFRLQRVAQRLHVPFVSQACKPLTLGINKALKLLKLEPSEVVMIGDQLFTDILAGSWNGMHTIWVRPPKLYEQKWMRLVRHLETFIYAREV